MYSVYRYVSILYISILYALNILMNLYEFFLSLVLFFSPSLPLEAGVSPECSVTLEEMEEGKESAAFSKAMGKDRNTYDSAINGKSFLPLSLQPPTCPLLSLHIILILQIFCKVFKAISINYVNFAFFYCFFAFDLKDYEEVKKQRFSIQIKPSYMYQ